MVHLRRLYLLSSRGTQSQTVRAERRIICSPTEMYRRYQDHRYILGCIVVEHIEDYWNVDVDRELSDAWTGFTRFIVLNKKPPDEYTWSGWRLTRKQTTSRPDNVWPDMWKHMSDVSKRKEKQKWAIEKPKLDNARSVRGIYFIDPDDEELKLFLKNTRRKLEFPMPAAMPFKIYREKYRETCGAVGEHKTKYACKRYAWRDFPTRIMTIISQEKG